MKFILVLVILGCLALIGFGIAFSVNGSDGTRSAPLSPAYQQHLTDQGWNLGATDPEVKLEYYADLQSETSRLVYFTIREAMQQTSDYAQLSFKHYPLANLDKSQQAAEAAEAAGRQGKFWEMIEIIYADQPEWKNDDPAAFRKRLSGYAGSIMLKDSQFKSDLDDGSIGAVISQNIVSGNEVPVREAPAVVVNGTALERLPRTTEELVAIIQAARQPRQ